MTLRTFLCVLVLTFGGLSAAGQEMRSKTMVSIPTGPDTVTFTVDRGETVSKNGVVVKFEPEIAKTGLMVGYQYEAASFDTLKPGDQIAIFIHGLSYGISYGGARDDTGARVFWGTFGTHLKGAFKPITIESMKRVGSTVTIAFTENAVLDDKKTVKAIKLALRSGWYAAVK
jgi:hypothetical protein